MKHITSKTMITAAFTAAVSFLLYSVPAFGADTYSDNWVLEADGTWTARDKNTNVITNAWFCDDAVAANGKDVWYLLDKDGKLVTAGLVQDASGNYYSLETDHDGYFGMLRYRSGVYDGIRLELDSDHNGSFAAIKNQEGIDALKEKYGLVTVTIGNGNIVYSSNEVRVSGTSPGWHTYANGKKYYYENDERVKGWKQIEEKYYYFDRSTGALLVNTYTPDGYRVDEEGVWDGKEADASKVTAKASSAKKTAASSGTSKTTAAATARTDSTAAVTEKASAVSSSDVQTAPGKSSTEEQGQDRNSYTPVWDAQAVSGFKNYVNKAKGYLNTAQSLYEEGKTMAAGRDKLKKYSKSIAQACAALDSFVSLDILMEERPALSCSDGTRVGKLSEKCQELLEDVGNLYFDDETDYDGSEIQAGMGKISTVLTYLGKMEAVANTL